MGTRLVIGFGAPVTPTGNSPVVTEVFDRAYARVWQGTVRLMTPRLVALDRGGTYLVRAWLPNGELLTEQVVVADGDIEAVSLNPGRRSPREEFGWAYYAQPQSPAGSINPGSLPNWYSGSEIIRYEYDGGFHPVAPDPLRARAHTFRREFSQQREVEVEVEGANDLTEGFQISRLTPTRLRVHADNGQTWLNIREPYSSLTETGHSFWIALPTLTRSVVDVLLSYDDEMNLRMNVQIEPDANALLSYISEGDYAMARVLSEELGDRAGQLLQQKAADPILATVAGYALLRAGDFRRMHDWSFNLADRFEDLPDGPVIAAWHVMRTTGDRSTARKYFDMAMERGVPLFSAGLRLLFELGEMIAAGENPASEGDRKNVADLRSLEAGRQRWSAVTVIRVRDLTDQGAPVLEREPEMAR